LGELVLVARMAMADLMTRLWRRALDLRISRRDSGPRKCRRQRRVFRPI